MIGVTVAEAQRLARAGQPWRVHLVCVDASRNVDKFWEVYNDNDGNGLYCRWGRNGTTGQTKRMDGYTAGWKKANEKLAEGYTYSDSENRSGMPVVVTVDGMVPSAGTASKSWTSEQSVAVLGPNWVVPGTVLGPSEASRYRGWVLSKEDIPSLGRSDVIALIKSMGTWPPGTSPLTAQVEVLHAFLKNAHNQGWRFPIFSRDPTKEEIMKNSENERFVAKPAWVKPVAETPTKKPRRKFDFSE